jgi:hypothetical protein
MSREESLAERRKVARMTTLYKAYNGERAWKDIGDRLHVSHHLRRDDHYWQIRARKQRTDVGKYSFVNRTIADWNRLPETVIGFYLLTYLLTYGAEPFLRIY